MTCPLHTTNEHYHTAPPQIAQSTAQPARNTLHTLRLVRSQSSENLRRSVTNFTRGRC